MNMYMSFNVINWNVTITGCHFHSHSHGNRWPSEKHGTKFSSTILPQNTKAKEHGDGGVKTRERRNTHVDQNIDLLMKNMFMKKIEKRNYLFMMI